MAIEWSDKSAKAQYMKEWRKANKERLAAYDKESRANNPAYQEWKRDYGKRYYQEVIKSDPNQMAARAAYEKDRSVKNPEQNNAKAARYRESHRKELARKTNAAYHAKTEEERRADRERRVEYQQKWRKENMEYFAAKQAEYRARNKPRAKANNAELYQNNTKEMKAKVAAWKKANPERARAILHAGTQRRRARIKEVGGSFTSHDVQRILAEQGNRCVGCKVDIETTYSVDHKMPISKGGTNDAENIQLLCLTCNLSKQAKTPEEWAAMRGLLFI